MLSKPRVMVVEDDEATLQVVAEAMREEFAVWVARNGTHALEVADELDWNADAIVVDIALGEGPRGDQFVAYYRTRAPRTTPVIVVSGVERAYELGKSIHAATVLPKPFDIDDLLSAVRIFATQH